jgi:hypothetical protein
MPRRKKYYSTGNLKRSPLYWCAELYCLSSFLFVLLIVQCIFWVSSAHASEFSDLWKKRGGKTYALSPSSGSIPKKSVVVAPRTIFSSAALAVCENRGGSSVLLVFRELAEFGSPSVFYSHPACDAAEYERGEIRGYSTNGQFHSGLIGSFYVICSPGFRTLSRPFNEVKSCSEWKTAAQERRRKNSDEEQRSRRQNVERKAKQDRLDREQAESQGRIELAKRTEQARITAKRNAEENKRRKAEVQNAKRIKTERNLIISKARAKFIDRMRAMHKDAIAVVIGNRNYTERTPDVEFAGNDANAFRKFLVDDLGYRKGNIVDIRDASLSQLNATFGTEKNHRGRLFDYVRAGKSDVIVFYSGHGVPGLQDRKGYLLPVDADPNRAELNGYPLDVLLANLAKVPARSMTVYIDACFSGESQKGMLVQATSGITVQTKVPGSSKAMVVVTAAQGDQFASWDEDAKHGLFTKHLLEALRGKADGDGFGNGDGKVTLAELRAYLDEEMTYQARRRWSRDQSASIQGEPGTVLATLR